MTGSAAPDLDHAGGWVAFLARRRVALGFLTGVAALLLSSPTWASWRAGLLIALAGEAVRVWAAGHLEKSREVTSSGPYRFTRHPLYVGSTLIAIGVVVASRSTLVAGLAAVYMGTTIAVAVRTEEAFLRRAFGDDYDRYRRAESAPSERRFSAARARRNGEHRALLGLAAGFALLALKVVLPI
jgi:protein-S-isoprenylcysteine O-methyltransferase Ste14